jgi:hypothetical protein
VRYPIARDVPAAEGRGRLLSAATATITGLLSLLALAGALVIAVLVPSAAGSFSAGAGADLVATAAGAIVFALSFTAVGVVVARRDPRNPMGWLLLGVALAIEIGSLAPGYAYLDYGRHHGSLPFGPVAVLLSNTWILLFVLLPLAVLLFPDGRLGAGWRWPLRAYLLVGAVFFAATFEVAARDLRLRLPVDNQGNLIGLAHPTGFVGAAWAVALLSSFALALAALVRQTRNYRHAGSERRQQLKWLTCGAALCLASGGVAVSNPSGIASDLLLPAGFAALPLSMGVGILRYRLYEIDRLVSRTLAYAILTALLAGIFIGLIVLTTDTLALSGRVGVAASTLAAAALFNPLRKRTQRLVDRRFNRARYDAESIVAAFTARLRDAVEIDSIRADLLDAVNSAVQPTHASVWIRK